MAVHQEVPSKPKNLRPVSETRKIRKPLMERKRRERINNSLEQLALLLKEANLVAPDKPLAKIEKADILELTVRHLTGNKESSSSNSKEEKLTEKNENREDHTTPAHITPIHSPTTKEQEISNNTLLVDGEVTKVDSKISKKDKTVKKCADNSSDARAAEDKRIGSYLEGFSKCFSEVQNAISETRDFVEIKDKLIHHLESCLLSITSSTKQLHSGEPKSVGVKRKMEDNTKSLPKTKKKLKADGSSDTEDSNCATSNSLTLVPMRLADGGVAFLLQGDTNIINVSGSKSTSTDTPSSCPNISVSNSTYIKPSTQFPNKIPIPPINKNKVNLPQTSVKPFIRHSNANNSNPIIVNSKHVNTSSIAGIAETRTSYIANCTSKIDPEQIPSYSISVSPANHQMKPANKVKAVTLPVDLPSSQSSATKPQSNLVSAPLQTLPHCQSKFVHILAKPTPSHITSKSSIIDAKVNSLHHVPAISQESHKYEVKLGNMPDSRVHLTQPNPSPSLESNHSLSSALAEPASATLYCKSYNSNTTIFPPSPPPSVPLNDQFSSTPIPNLSTANSDAYNSQPSDSGLYKDSSSTGTFSSVNTSNANSFSLLSTSVQLLSCPPYNSNGNTVSGVFLSKNETEEEEFIDVENVSKDDSNNSINEAFNFAIQNNIECSFSKMWRPW